MADASDFQRQQTPPQTPTHFPRVVEASELTAHVKSVSGIVKDIGNESVTVRAEAIRHHTDEAMIWQARPSLVLLIQPILKAILVIAAIVVSCWALQEQLAVRWQAAQVSGANEDSVVTKSHKTGRVAKIRPAAVQGPTRDQIEQISIWLKFVPIATIIVALVIVLWRTAQLRMTQYAATSQRLIVESGVLRTHSCPYELHRLGSAIITRPLLWRMFGIAHLAIPSHGVLLRGIRNVDYVRDILRNAGQIEAQDAGKIRWR